MVETFADGLLPEHRYIYPLHLLPVHYRRQRSLQVDAKSPGDLFSAFSEFLLIAGLVGCIEEILFSLSFNFLRDMHAVSAVCASNLFSFMHFFRVKLLVSPGFQPFISFRGNLSIRLPNLLYHHFPHLVWHLPGRRCCCHICLPENKFPLFLLSGFMQAGYLSLRPICCSSTM